MAKEGLDTHGDTMSMCFTTFDEYIPMRRGPMVYMGSKRWYEFARDAKQADIDATVDAREAAPRVIYQRIADIVEVQCDAHPRRNQYVNLCVTTLHGGPGAYREWHHITCTSEQYVAFMAAIGGAE